MIGVLQSRAVMVPRALQIALGRRRAVLGTSVLFIIILGFYAMLLPATSTGGLPGPAALRFLTLSQFLLAVVMAAILALTFALGLHGLSRGAGIRAGGGVLGAILASLPALLCCSPVLPLAITTIAAVVPAAGALGLPLQGFIATHENGIYAVAIVLMVWGLFANARRILSCAR